MVTAADACPHLTFTATVEVNRLTTDAPEPTVTNYSADLRVSCADCREPFEWIGAPVGLDPRHPTISLDGQELRAPLRPLSSPPGFGESGPGFHVRRVQ